MPTQVGEGALTMKTKHITAPIVICFSLVLTSVTWLYPSSEPKANPQTLCSGNAVVARTGESELLVTPAAKKWVQFQDFANEWKTKRGSTSSITQMSVLEPYQKIIGLGEDAVPFILAQLKSEGDEPDQWFWALKMITGANPVLPEQQGDFRAMAKAWITWGENQQYAG